MTEDEMVGWHHRLNGHGFVWTPGVRDGQGGLACCGSWGHKELGTTERLNLIFKYCPKFPISHSTGASLQMLGKVILQGSSL